MCGEVYPGVGQLHQGELGGDVGHVEPRDGGLLLPTG